MPNVEFWAQFLTIFGAVTAILAATSAALLGAQLSAREKAKHPFLNSISQRRVPLIILCIGSSILSAASFLAEKELDRRQQKLVSALEDYLRIDALFRSLDLEFSEPSISVSPRVQKIAAQLPDTGSRRVRALKALGEKDYAKARELLSGDDGADEGQSSGYDYYLLRALIENYSGEFNQAVYWYRRALHEPQVDLALLSELSDALARAGQYENALALAEPTLQAQVAIFGSRSERLFRSRLVLSSIFQDLGLYKDAQQVLASACEDLVGRVGSDPIDESQCLKRRAAILLELGDFTEAETQIDRGIDSLGPKEIVTNDQRAELHRLRGNLLQELGRFDDAGREYKKCLDLLKSLVGPRHPYIALVLSDFGDAMLQQAQTKQALEAYREGEGILKEIQGPSRQLALTIHHNLARLAEAQEDFPKAENLYIESRRQALAFFGNRPHRDFATITVNLALLYDRWGKQKKAEELHREAIDTITAILGPEHPLLGTALNNYGSHLRAAKDWAESERHHLRALDIFTKTGQRHEKARVLNSLGALYFEMRKFSKAEEVLSEACDTLPAVYGEIHPMVAVCVNNLANARMDLADLEGAQIAFKRATKIIEHLVSRGQFNWLLPVMENYAKLLDKTNPVEARELRRRLQTYQTD